MNEHVAELWGPERREDDTNIYVSRAPFLRLQKIPHVEFHLQAPPTVPFFVDVIYEFERFEDRNGEMFDMWVQTSQKNLFLNHWNWCEALLSLLNRFDVSGGLRSFAMRNGPMFQESPSVDFEVNGNSWMVKIDSSISDVARRVYAMPRSSMILSSGLVRMFSHELNVLADHMEELGIDSCGRLRKNVERSTCFALSLVDLNCEFNSIYVPPDLRDHVLQMIEFMKGVEGYNLIAQSLERWSSK